MDLSLNTHGRFGRFVAQLLFSLVLAIGLKGFAQDLQPLPIGADLGSLLKTGTDDYDITGRGTGSTAGLDQLMFSGAMSYVATTANFAIGSFP